MITGNQRCALCGITHAGVADKLALEYPACRPAAAEVDPFVWKPLFSLATMDKSIAAYVRAAEIAERDYLRGTAPVSDQAARAYYYTMLALLDADAVPESVQRTIDMRSTRLLLSLSQQPGYGEWRRRTSNAVR